MVVAVALPVIGSPAAFTYAKGTLSVVPNGVVTVNPSMPLAHDGQEPAQRIAVWPVHL